jgi:hypothetical protein
MKKKFVDVLREEILATVPEKIRKNKPQMVVAVQG